MSLEARSESMLELTVDPLSVVVDDPLDETLALEVSDRSSGKRSVDLKRERGKATEGRANVSFGHRQG